MGRGPAQDPRVACSDPALIAFLDTNVIIRHLTGDPPAQARRATAFLRDADRGSLLLADLIVAESIYVLESFYELPPMEVALRMRAVLAHPSMTALDAPTLHRALELYELERLDFAEAYLAAQAEASGVGVVASFDKTLDRVESIERIGP